MRTEGNRSTKHEAGIAKIPVKRLVIRILKLILFIPAGLYEITLLVSAGLLIPFVHFKFTKKSSKDIASVIINHAHTLPSFKWYIN